MNGIDLFKKLLGQEERYIDPFLLNNFYFTSTQPFKIRLNKSATTDADKTYLYSVGNNGGNNFTQLTTGLSTVTDAASFIDVPANYSVFFKINSNTFSNITNNEISGIYQFQISGAVNTRVAVKGNILQLHKTSGVVQPGDFIGLFQDCINLDDASDLILPNTTNILCYTQMFEGCTNLTSAPVLPATILSACCYEQMFKECKSLTTPPKLPATSLGLKCYEGMFAFCTNLTSTPYLPASKLAEGCYMDMFWGCENLNKTFVQNLPAKDLESYCYTGMFGGCASLTSAPYLPATGLALGCYMDMFAYCTSLSNAPSLPATSLTNAPYCYNYMFGGCTSLTSVSTLSATSIEQGSYGYMFSGCTALTTGPQVSGIYIGSYGYEEMFADCTHLTNIPIRNIARLGEYSCCQMFRGCTALNNTLPNNIISTSVDIFPKGCLSGMFKGCTSLINGQSLFLGPTSSALGNGCYSQLFADCTNLTTPPQLQPIKLAPNCYRGMFINCSHLTSGPLLKSAGENLAYNCYAYMFSGCASLTSISAALDVWGLDDEGAPVNVSGYYTYNWVSGVNTQNGIFYGSPELSGNKIKNGAHYIPIYWTKSDTTIAGRSDKINTPTYTSVPLIENFPNFPTLEGDPENQLIYGTNPDDIPGDTLIPVVATCVDSDGEVHYFEEYPTYDLINNVNPNPEPKPEPTPEEKKKIHHSGIVISIGGGGRNNGFFDEGTGRSTNKEGNRSFGGTINAVFDDSGQSFVPSSHPRGAEDPDEYYRKKYEPKYYGVKTKIVSERVGTEGIIWVNPDSTSNPKKNKVWKDEYDPYGELTTIVYKNCWWTLKDNVWTKGRYNDDNVWVTNDDLPASTEFGIVESVEKYTMAHINKTEKTNLFNDLVLNTTNLTFGIFSGVVQNNTLGFLHIYNPRGLRLLIDQGGWLNQDKGFTMEVYKPEVRQDFDIEIPIHRFRHGATGAWDTQVISVKNLGYRLNNPNTSYKNLNFNQSRGTFWFSGNVGSLSGTLERPSRMVKEMDGISHQVEMPIAPLSPINTSYGMYYSLFENWTGLKSVINSPIPPSCELTWYQERHNEYFDYDKKNNEMTQEAATTLLNTQYPNYYCANMFKGCTNLTSFIQGELRPGDGETPVMSYSTTLNVVSTSNAYSFAHMFEGCNHLSGNNFKLLINLTSVPGSGAFDAMFKDCTNLSTINVSARFDIADNDPSKVIGSYACRNMFKNCTSLTAAPLSGNGKYTYGAYSLNGTFYRCSNLVSVNFEGLMNCTNANQHAFDSTFYNCSKLTHDFDPRNYIQPRSAPGNSTSDCCIEKNAGFIDYWNLSSVQATPSKIWDFEMPYYGWVIITQMAAGVDAGQNSCCGCCCSLKLNDFPLYNFHEYNNTNTWILPFKRGKRVVVSCNSAVEVRIAPGYSRAVKYPLYQDLSENSSNWDLVPSNGYTAASNGWLRVSIKSGSYFNLQLTDGGGRGDEQIPLYSGNGPGTTFLLPILIGTGISYYYSGDVDVRFVAEPTQGSDYVAYPNYNALGTKGVDISNGSTAPGNGWFFITVGPGGECSRVNLHNTNSYINALPLYQTNHALNTDCEITYMLPVQQGASFNWYTDDSGSTSPSPLCAKFIAGDIEASGPQNPNINTSLWNALPMIQISNTAQSYSFYQTFYGCGKLYVPPVLYVGQTTQASAYQYMLAGTTTMSAVFDMSPLNTVNNNAYYRFLGSSHGLGNRDYNFVVYNSNTSLNFGYSNPPIIIVTP